MRMPPPVIGHHRFSYCGRLYRDIHKFLAVRQWKPVDVEGSSRGVTWIELFILFDTTKARSEQAIHVKDEAAKQRADARAKKRWTEGGRRSKQKGQAIVEPTLDEELKRFKAICRSIFKHELDQIQSPWFDMERRARLRRLGGLAVTGNQPALLVHVKATDEEKAVIARSIMQQKIGSNHKTMKKYDEHKARQKEQVEGGEEQGRKESETILLKFARIAVGCKARWTRTFKTTNEEEASEEPQDESQGRKSMPYSSRLIACNRCGLQQETKKMQLRTTEGYRAMHCKGCGKQERTSRNHCQCKVIWHQCDIHRHDPQVHASRRGVKESLKRPLEEIRLSSTRKAPLTRNAGWWKPLQAKSKRAEKHEADIVRHVKFAKSNAPPCEKVLQRFRARARNAIRHEEVCWQSQELHGCDDLEARRLNKKRRIDEACLSLSAVGAVITSNAITMHASGSSKYLNSNASMRIKSDDQGMGIDQRSMLGSASSSRARRSTSENEAICRLLSSSIK